PRGAASNAGGAKRVFQSNSSGRARGRQPRSPRCPPKGVKATIGPNRQSRLFPGGYVCYLQIQPTDMEIKQQLRLSQQLVMTPQLQQAIKLLQLSRLELVDEVRKELDNNPVLSDED